MDYSLVTNSSTNSTYTGCTSDDVTLSSASLVSLILINSCCCLIGSIGNILVLITILMNTYLHTVPDYFVFSLALADLLVTLIQNPILVFKLRGATYQCLPHSFDIITEATKNFSLLASISSMFLITMDRFLAIQKPFKYSAIATKEIAIYTILWVWCACLALVIGHVFLTGTNQYVFISGYIASLLFLIILMYIYLYIETKRQENKMFKVIVPENTACCRREPKCLNASRQKHDRKAIKTIAVVVGFFLGLWMPYLVFTISYANSAYTIVFQQGFYWVYSLCLCNSTINPYIYCARSNRYRKAFVKLLRIKKIRITKITNHSVMPQRQLPVNSDPANRGTRDQAGLCSGLHNQSGPYGSTKTIRAKTLKP